MNMLDFKVSMVKKLIKSLNIGENEIVCYVIAKDRYAHGCIAFKTVHGKHLADLKEALNKALNNTGVEIMTISRPEAYGEYAPYHFVQTEEEFSAQTLSLRL